MKEAKAVDEAYAIYFDEDQFDIILKWMEEGSFLTIQEAVISAINKVRHDA